MADSWKIDGDCSVCRRKSYCSTPCKLAKLRRDHYLRSAVASVMLKAMAGGYSDDERKDKKDSNDY